jgi:ceramide glucosyltransferase
MNAVHATSLLLGVSGVVSAIYFVIAAGLLARWQRTGALGEEGGSEVESPAATFFRPLKAGVPDLPAKLAVLARALRPGDQLLIGAEAGSAEYAAAEALRDSNSELEIVAVACEPGMALNPKIGKLLQMEPLARHEHWILSDSEAVTDAAFLAAFRREWTECDVLTAGYRFSRVQTWPQSLDAAATLLTLWPGLAVLRAWGRLDFTLGACTGFRRRDLQAIGGWPAFAEELAEDNRLGKKLAAAGRDIRLSAQVVTLESDPLSWRDYWRHQSRVAVTYRVANPAGFAGAFFTQGVTTSLLLAAWQPGCMGMWLLFFVVFAVRVLTARHAAKLLAFPIPWLAPVVLVASIVETACWLLSWGTRSVWWSGRWRPIAADGRLKAEPRLGRSDL